MSWLTNFVRPKLQALVRRSDVPDNLWDKCPSCGQMLFHRELGANLHVCTNCGHHLRLPPELRLALLAARVGVGALSCRLHIRRCGGSRRSTVQ